MEGKLPEYNTRVKLPQTQRDNVYDGMSLCLFYYYRLGVAAHLAVIQCY